MDEKDKRSEKKWKWYVLERKSVSLLIVLLIAILFYVGLNHVDVIAVRVRMFTNVMMPFIAGFAIAYLLNTPMCFFERRVFKRYKHRRGLSILTVYLLALAIVVILLNLIIPQVAQSVIDLATNMQGYLNSLDKLVQELIVQFDLDAEGVNGLLGSYQDLIQSATQRVSEALPQLLGFGYAVGTGVVSGITAVISSIYMLAGKGRLVPQLKKLIYAVLAKPRADWLLDVCSRANRILWASSTASSSTRPLSVCCASSSA